MRSAGARDAARERLAPHYLKITGASEPGHPEVIEKILTHLDDWKAAAAISGAALGTATRLSGITNDGHLGL